MTGENGDSRFAWGAKAIGKIIDRTERQTYHLLETGNLPAKKLGGRWVGAVAKLRAAVGFDDSSSE